MIVEAVTLSRQTTQNHKETPEITMKLVLLVQTQTDREVLIRKAQAAEDFCLVCLIDLCASSSCKVLVLTKKSTLFSHDSDRNRVWSDQIGLGPSIRPKCQQSLQNGAAFCGLGRAARKPDRPAASPPGGFGASGLFKFAGLQTRNRPTWATLSDGGPRPGPGRFWRLRPHNCRTRTSVAASVTVRQPLPGHWQALTRSSPTGSGSAHTFPATRARVRAPPEATQACSRVPPLHSLFG